MNLVIRDHLKLVFDSTVLRITFSRMLEFAHDDYWVTYPIKSLKKSHYVVIVAFSKHFLKIWSKLWVTQLTWAIEFLKISAIQLSRQFIFHLLISQRFSRSLVTMIIFCHTHNMGTKIRMPKKFDLWSFRLTSAVFCKNLANATSLWYGTTTT